MKHTRTLCAVAGIAAGGAALAYLAGFGPLDPPDGPVAETSPSLAELDEKLDQVLLSTGSLGGGSLIGPWDVFRAPATGNLISSLNSQEIASGRVYVKSIAVFYAYATVFDGPGEMDSMTRPVTPNWIARNTQLFSSTGTEGKGQLATSHIPIDQIVENGLHVSWRSESNGGYVVVRYRVLDEGENP